MTTAAQQPTWVQPEIPSKFDIIPVHNSDRASFKRCRRYWDWSSPTRTNLTVRADIHGVNPDLFFGTGIHYALEQFYQPGIKRDPIEAFKTWWNIQWRGGTVTEEWLDRVYDLQPKLASQPIEHEVKIDLGTMRATEDSQPLLYRVRGLEDILPDPDHNEWEALFELGIKMLEFYKEYAAREDGYEVLVAEHMFSVPIWDYELNTILKRVDMREDSPNYGKMLEVHARGKMDVIAVKPNGKLFIRDYKTTSRWGEDELEKLEANEQATSYLYCAEVEASYYDLPHAGQPIEEVVFDRLRKTFPRPPTMLQNGMFSISRTDESTTYSMLCEFIAREMPGVTLSEKQQNYVDYVREMGDEQFIVRKAIRRNRHQLQNAGIRMYQEALDMLDPDLRIYPNISNDWACLRCTFRAPCLGREDGSDWEQMIADNYTSNKDR